MRRLYIFVLLLVAAVWLQAQDIPSGYYNNAANKTGDQLKAALHTIITNNDSHTSYDGLWTSYQTTDLKPNSSIIWDIYSNVQYTYQSGQCGNYSGEGDCYNREHLWAQSWTNNDATEKTDLHHVYPTDGFVNSKRSNYAFGEVSNPTYTSGNGGKLGPNTISGFTGTVFEPVDEYKGDIARALMYVSVRYYGLDGSWDNSDMTTKSVIKDWAMTMLLDWHENDPVSQKEIDRNEAVYGIQHNRNPFVDHPEYARMIWDPNWTPGSQIAVSANTESGGIAYIDNGYTAKTVAIDFSAQGYSNGAAVSSATIEAGVITVAFNEGSGSNSPKYYDYGESIRCYGGNNFVVNATGGKSIVSISLVYGEADGSNAISTNVGEFATDTWTGSASSVTFSLASGSGNRRIHAMSVTYSSGTPSYQANFTNGNTATIKAVPKAGYSFVNWTKGGNHVSNNATYSFTVTADETYVANFTSNNVTANTTLPYLTLSDNALITIASNKKLTVTGAVTASSSATVEIGNGGQFVSETTGISGKVKKNVVSWTAATSTGWNAISTPIDNVAFANVTNLIPSGSYNVYRLNEVTMTWENSQNSANSFSSLANGRGYLYRKENNYTLEFDGTLNAGSVNYPLTYTSQGFHLVGNPYPHNIYKGNGAAIPNTYLEDGFYSLSSVGAWIAGTDNTTAIAPCQAILVQAKNTVVSGNNLTITKTTATGAAKDRDDNIMFAVSNSEYNDVAYAMFKEGHGLNKIDHRNEAIQKLCIENAGEDFAIADIDREVKAFNLKFHAATMGKYTMKISVNGAFSYLHLIDKLTGNDLDLLIEDEYSFIGSPKDDDSRFIVRMEMDGSSSQDNSIFAYQNGNSIIIDGSGELQIFDMMGRVVATLYVNGAGTVCTSSMPTGVYILRLIGEDMRTQKIVVK